MALIVTDNSVRQINAALLSLEKKIGETNSEKAQDKQVVQMELKNIQYNFMAPLYQNGNSVSINTTGTWEGNARSATTAEHAITADNVEHADTATSAETATNANHADTATQATNATNADTATNAVHAETAETTTKVANALTVNGKTYDGSSAVNAGVQTVANGGTGVTSQEDINKSFIGNLEVGNSDVTDGTEFVSSWASDNGFAETGGLNKPYKRKFIKVWNYIQNKISSVLGLTKDNYGGKASTAGNADTADTANTATSANLSKTLDTVNGDKLQIGSGTAQNITNAKHAATADYAKNMYFQTLDLSSLDNTKFYPIFCISKDNFAEVAIHSPGFGGSEPYNQNRIHFDISTYGWTDMPFTLNIREYACFDNNEITIGCIGRGYYHGGWAIWLRGGLRYSCWTINCELSLKTTDYTYYDEKYTVGTNYYGGENTSVSIVFTPQSTITNGAYSNRNVVAPNITSLEQRTASLESNKVSISELDEKLNSPLPWRYNYLGSGYSSSLQYRKFGEGNFTYPTGNWSFYSEIDVLYHIPNGVIVRGTIFVGLRGNGSNIYVKTVKYNSKNGVFNYLSKTKVNYKLDTTNKKIYLELLAYCDISYTMIIFRNSLTRTGDMLFNADNFWTFAANGSYPQSATTMQAGATDGYTEIPLELIDVDRYGRDIVTTYATKTELTNAVPTYSASDAGKVLAVNSDGTGTEWIKL